MVDSSCTLHCIRLKIAEKVNKNNLISSVACIIVFVMALAGALGAYSAVSNTNYVSQQINKLELMDQEQHTTQISETIWPTSFRAAEKPSPPNLHVPSNQQHSHTVTHASNGEP